jgi:hypothetical protein
MIRSLYKRYSTYVRHCVNSLASCVGLQSHIRARSYNAVENVEIMVTQHKLAVVSLHFGEHPMEFAGMQTPDSTGDFWTMVGRPDEAALAFRLPLATDCLRTRI